MRLFLKSNLSEIVIYIIIWLFILAEPVFISMDGSISLSKHFLRDWLRDIPIFVFFIVNTLWLVPKFLYNKKIVYYIGLLIVLGIASALAGEIIFTVGLHIHINPPEMGPPMPHPPMHGFGPEMPPPRSLLGFGLIHQMVISLLIISLSTAIKVTIKWFKDEQARREIEKEYLKSELTFLQNQISPHFFMNTLNNIHALIDIDGKNAQLAIVKLSKMMRYLLYESEQGNTTLKKEIEFLNSYIDLMKLRIYESVNIELSFPQNYRNAKLPPFLLIPFIENAFKHGVSYREKSFITISLEQEGDSIIFLCSNSLLAQNAPAFGNNGIGLKNVKKRLDLLYGDTYKLLIDDSGSEFYVKLILPVYEH